MTGNRDLFGMTFDQQVRVAGRGIAQEDISPNRRFPGEIVLEPVPTGVRVTARDENHRVLWGFVGSKATVEQVHCLVAIYETLRDLLRKELDESGLPSVEVRDPMERARAALDELEKTVKWLRRSLGVKKVSEATEGRARTIARIAADANRQISLEADALKGMKPKSDRPAARRSRRTGSIR